MAYNFRLETLLNYRRNIEEQAQLKLARQLQILEDYTKRLNELRAARIQAIDEFEKRKKKKMAGYLFSFFMEAINSMEGQIEAQHSIVEAQKKNVNKVRRELLEKVKEKKIIERAKDKDYEKYLKEMLKQVQKEGDEQVLLRFGKKDNLL